MGKGSALASLADDEVAKIKAFLSGGGAKPAAPFALWSQRPSSLLPTAPVAPAQPTVFRREDYIAPTGSAGRPPSLPTRSESKSADSKAQARPTTVAASRPWGPPSVWRRCLPRSSRRHSPRRSNLPLKSLISACRLTRSAPAEWGLSRSPSICASMNNAASPTKHQLPLPPKGSPTRLPADSPLGGGTRDRGRRGKAGTETAAGSRV